MRKPQLRTPGARPYKPRVKYDGALEVRPILVDFTPCDIPGCAGGIGNVNSGRRPAHVELYVIGRSLGAYCEKHGRELRRVWVEAA